ncbi:Uncharacterised protein (plasmid) [Mesomycoplasma conjunctivae]|nr:hypothetical protein [Mycoplasmopsis fermentans]VEU67418.1 Uncharacterised protein [Mesomycoplasma conjunctivae]ADV34124.1 Hypothetical Protein MfeM64YM_0115 [Mycoplasmopsis fermentans M64]ADV34252.1 Hypothetical Protein MfeM64YM_0246 [Mycoplasmopsis fermentans M64]VEU60277.1 Uncharacterised protein [Mycoplasmopsis fermentans]VEU64233.1 Uncharacterised protein [Mycoplasmopsis fermentans]
MKKLKNFLLGISSTIPASGVFLISSTNSKNEDSFNNWNESIKDKCPIKNANWEEIFDILKSKLPYKKDIELVSYSGMKDNLNSKLKLNKFSGEKTPKEELLQYWKNLDINLALNNYLKNKSINKNEFFKFDFEIVENQYLNIYLINENVNLNKTSRYLLIKNQKIKWKLSSDISQLNWKERLIINYGYSYKINNDGTIQIKQSKSKNITSNEIICEYPPTEIYFVSPQNLQEKFEIRIESENGEKIVTLNNNEIFYSAIDIRKIVKNKLNFSNKLFLIHEDSNGIKEKIQIKFEKSDISNTIDLKYPNWNPDLLEYKQFISKNELNKDGNEIKDANGNPVPSKKYDPGIDPKTGLKSEIVWLNFNEFHDFLKENIKNYCSVLITEKESKFLYEFMNDKKFRWVEFLINYEILKEEFDLFDRWNNEGIGPYPNEGRYIGKNIPYDEQEKNIKILYELRDLYARIQDSGIDKSESINIDRYFELKQIVKKYKNHFDSTNCRLPFGSFYLKYKSNNSSVLAEAIKTQYLTINANSNILIRELKQNSIGKWEFVNDLENMEISNLAPGNEIKLTKNGFYLIYDISLDKTNINKFKIVWIDNNSTTYTKPSYLTEEANSPSFIKKFWRNKNLKVSNDFEKYLAKKKIIDLNATKKDLDKLKYDDIFNEYNNFLIEKSFEENFEIKPEININKLRQDFKTNEQFLNYINQKDNEAKFIENYVISKNKEFLTIKNCYFDSKSNLIKVVIDLKENASLNSFFIRRKIFNINLELKPIFIKFNNINIEEHIPFNVFVNELINNFNNLIESAKDINNEDIDLNIIELKILKESDENQIIVKAISKDANYYIANNDTYTYNVNLLKSDYSYLLNFNPGTLNVFGLKDKEEIKKYIKELLKNYLIQYNEKIDQSLYKKITIDDINISFNDEELNKIINPKDDDIYWNKDENIAKFTINFNNNFKTYHPCTLHVINNALDDDFNWPEAGLTVKVNVDMENKKDPVKMAQIKNETIRQVREKIIEEFKKRAPKLEIDKLYTIDFTDSFFNNLDLAIGTTLTLKGKHFMLKNPYTVNVINTHSSANKKLNLKDLNFEVITLSEKNLNDFKKALNEKIIDILKKENYPAKEIIKLIEFKLLENQKWDSFFSKIGNNELKMMIQLKEESNLISGDKEFKLINIFTEEMLKEALEIKSKNKKKLLSWLIPVIILSVAGIIATVIAIWYRKKKKRL